MSKKRNRANRAYRAELKKLQQKREEPNRYIEKLETRIFQCFENERDDQQLTERTNRILNVILSMTIVLFNFIAPNPLAILPSLLTLCFVISLILQTPPRRDDGFERILRQKK